MKKFLIPMLVVLLAVGSAFTIKHTPASTVDKKWFRFDGDPGEEMDASLYSVVSSPSCTSTTASYRCEIYIETQGGNTNLPDLNHTPTEERKKTAP